MFCNFQGYESGKFVPKWPFICNDGRTGRQATTENVRLFMEWPSEDSNRKFNPANLSTRSY